MAYPLGTEVTLFFQFRKQGAPADPTTVTFTIERPDNAVEEFVFGVDSEVTNPVNPDTGDATGYYECLYRGPIGGTYDYKVNGEGAVVAVSPTYSFELLPDAIGQAPVYGIGTCEPWIDPQDVAACCSADVGSDVGVFADAAQAASNLLWRLSARQIPGICERTVRPQPEWFCGWQVLARGYLIGPGDWSSRPYAPSAILLPNYPVQSIVEVLLDGDVVPADEYRLDRNRYLVRGPDTDGKARVWPANLRDDLASSEVGTMEVTYTHGLDPPVEATMAAAQLACEIYKACPQSGVAANGGDCAIPQRAVRVSKQGITIELGALSFDRSKERWDTGMKMVDVFLQAWNPRGLKRRPAIWSPDDPRFAQEVGVVGST